MLNIKDAVDVCQSSLGLELLKGFHKRDERQHDYFFKNIRRSKKHSGWWLIACNHDQPKSMEHFMCFTYKNEHFIDALENGLIFSVGKHSFSLHEKDDEIWSLHFELGFDVKKIKRFQDFTEDDVIDRLSSTSPVVNENMFVKKGRNGFYLFQDFFKNKKGFYEKYRVLL
jgi:hypothetical protein